MRNSFLLFGKKKREEPPFFLVKSPNFQTRSSRSPEKMQLSLQVSIRPQILSLQVAWGMGADLITASSLGDGGSFGMFV